MLNSAPEMIDRFKLADKYHYGHHKNLDNKFVLLHSNISDIKLIRR